MDDRAGVGDGARDPFRLLLARLHDPERDAFRRARTDPGHLPQLRDQVADRGGIFRASHREAHGSETGAGSADHIQADWLEPAQIPLQGLVQLPRCRRGRD